MQLLTLYLPFGGVGTLSFGRNDSVGLTVVLCLLTINAINFIDGLDGLAAGVSAIAALAFFAYSYHLAREGYGDVAFAPTLLSAVLAGACLGFLPHNFSPARVFMGDSGSMLIGLTLAAAATTASTGADPQTLRQRGQHRPAVPAVPAAAGGAGGARWSTWCWRCCAGSRPAARRSRRTRCTCTTGCWRSATRTAARCCSSTSGPRCSPSAGWRCRSWSDPLPVLSVVGALAAVALVLSSVPRLRASRRPS